MPHSGFGATLNPNHLKIFDPHQSFFQTLQIFVKTLTQRQCNNNSTKVGFDMKMTLQTTPPHHRNSMFVISQLLLTRFWRDFKCRFMGLSWTGFNCHSNICPGNICPGDICPYPEYLSCYRPNFDQTLKVGSWDYLEQISTVEVTFVEASFVQTTFVLATFVHIKNISAVTDPILTKL